MPKKRTELKCANGIISYGYLLKKAVLPEILVCGYASIKKRGGGMAGVGTWCAGTYAGGGQNVLVFRDSSMFAIKGYNCLVCRSPDMACKSTLWYTYWYVK